MKFSAPHRGWTSGRATPSLRPNPYAANPSNPAEPHLSFAEICPDNRDQLSFSYVGLRFGEKITVVAARIFDIDFGPDICGWFGLRVQDARCAYAKNKAANY